MITVEQIKRAQDAEELETLVSQALLERGFDFQLSDWDADADAIEQDVLDGAVDPRQVEDLLRIVTILRAAEERRLKLQK